MPLEVLNDKARLNSLKEMLHRHSVPAAEALIQREDNGDVRCFACGHRCLIKPGRDGVCRVRFNDNGTLLVPHGYVGALACDPIEKKPFFHVLPGSDALTFGMLGCDYHCGYCFTPETIVMTDRGPMRFDALHDACPQRLRESDAEIGFLQGVRTISASGNWRSIEKVFRHCYRGELIVVRPFGLAPLRCTPDHRVFATRHPSERPQLVSANDLVEDCYLCVPRVAARPGNLFSIDVAELLKGHSVRHHVRWKLPASNRALVLSETASGRSSRQIGLLLGKSASYIRHVRGKLGRNMSPEARRAVLQLDDEGLVRFPHERGRGIPGNIELNEDLATLLGYFCAEGSVLRDNTRPNSYKITFSFGHKELLTAKEVIALLRRCFGINSQLSWRSTTLAVCAGKASAALLLTSLCGSGAANKRVPPQLFESPPRIIDAFLRAYVSGDGHRYRNGKISVTTVSEQLAYGCAMLVLQQGSPPAVYQSRLSQACTIQGRAVRRRPFQYTVVWYEKTAAIKRRMVETNESFLIPIRSISREQYDGDVFNMQVADEHTYLANLLGVSNCQNWVTSQMLRDVDAVSAPKFCTPRQLVDIAIEQGAPVVASSYNEPLITSEWAVDVFKEARARDLKCAYISNGNGTPQVLDFIRPYVEAYKVDLKTFNPRHYRELGGVMENVTDTIRMLKERGFWVEIVTLVVPGFSDDPDELKRMADFLAGIDVLMPWHMTAFHPDYKMTEGYRATTAEDLMRIVEFGRNAGLKYMYPGNRPGEVGEWENTRCHHCGATVIERYGFQVLRNRVAESGNCPDCGKHIPGIWGKSSGHGDGRVRPLI